MKELHEESEEDLERVGELFETDGGGCIVIAAGGARGCIGTI